MGAAAHEQLDRGETERGAEDSGDEADHHALDRREFEEIPRPGAPGAEQRQVAAVALARSQSGEVGDTEGDQCAGDRQQQEQGLGVERVAGGGVERVGEVVDELDLARQRALNPVHGLGRPASDAVDGLPAASGPRSSCACTCHWVPVWAPGCALAPEAPVAIVGRRGASVLAKVLVSMIAAFCGGCAGAGPSSGLSGWKTWSGAVIRRDAADLVSDRRGVRARPQPDRVPDPGLERRRHLLVEDDAAGSQATLQQAEGVDVGRVVGGTASTAPWEVWVEMPPALRSAEANGAVAAAAA